MENPGNHSHLSEKDRKLAYAAAKRAVQGLCPEESPQKKSRDETVLSADSRALDGSGKSTWKTLGTLNLLLH